MTALLTNKKPQTRLSTILRIMKYIALFFIGIVVTIILLNLKGEKLKPEVVAILKAPSYQVADQNNGFFMMIYLNRQRDFDAMKEGAALFNHAEAKFYANPQIDLPEVGSNIGNNIPLKNFEWVRCIENNENCLSDLINNREKYQAMINESSVMLERYEQLLKMTEFEEHVIPSQTYIPHISSFIKSFNITLAQASLHIHDGKVKQGLQKLESNNALVRLMLKNTKGIISRIVSIKALKNQTHIINQLMNTYPELAQQHAPAMRQLVRPLSLEEQQFSTVFQNERRFTIHTMHQAYKNLGSEDHVTENIATPKFTKLIHPEIILNAFFDSFTPLIQNANLPANQYDEAQKNIIEAHEKQMATSLFPYVNFISKQTAKILTNVSPPTLYLTYLNGNANLNTLLELVSTHVNIKAQKIDRHQIAEFLKNNANPMQWHNQTQQLSLPAKNEKQLEGTQQAITITINNPYDVEPKTKPLML